MRSAPAPSQTLPAPARALAELLNHAIDYAGLYPPAALSLDAAAREYAEQRDGPHAWALGRFVIGLDQVPALVPLRAPFGGGPWPLSVLISSAAPDLTVFERQRDSIRSEAIEAKGNTTAEIDRLEPLVAKVSELYVELPSGAPLGDLLAALRALGARAKIRTGGVTPDAIPPAPAVAHFLRACAEARVPFKATAGLHHLVRGEYPLTYEPGSARATMFGFLNVFVAAALAVRGADEPTLTRVLDERDTAAFRVTKSDDALCWRDDCLTLDDLRAARAQGISGFGSCSFAEPVTELGAAGLSSAA